MSRTWPFFLTRPQPQDGTLACWNNEVRRIDEVQYHQKCSIDQSAQEWTNRTPNATNKSIVHFLLLPGSQSSFTEITEHNYSKKLSNILYHLELSIASFRFCETCLLNIKPFVANKSAIFPFLGGKLEVQYDLLMKCNLDRDHFPQRASSSFQSPGPEKRLWYQGKQTSSISKTTFSVVFNSASTG